MSSDSSLVFVAADSDEVADGVLTIETFIFCVRELAAAAAAANAEAATTVTPCDEGCCCVFFFVLLLIVRLDETI